MDLQLYRVKSGAVLAHAGEALTSGEDVQLPPHVAYEVRHLVDPVDAVTGAVQPWGTVDQAVLETELAKARPHERVSLIQQALDAKQGDVKVLEKLLVAAQKDEAAAAKALDQKSAKKSAPAAASDEKK